MGGEDTTFHDDHKANIRSVINFTHIFYSSQCQMHVVESMYLYKDKRGMTQQNNQNDTHYNY